jgi:putative PIN family toxin of toxin-antitoxin system
MPNQIKIVLDTNVLYSGLYSSRGASFKILQAIAENKLKTVLSTPLLFEYEDVLKRNQSELELSIQEIEKTLNWFCLKSQHQKIYFLWRPCLPDPKDDHLLELAVASRTGFIITHNIKDFKGAEKFNVRPITPKKFLERI